MHTLLAGLHVEELEFRADDGPDGWVPLRIVSLPPDVSGGTRRRPVVIFLHATGEWQVVDGVDVAVKGRAAECVDQSRKCDGEWHVSSHSVTRILLHRAALMSPASGDWQVEAMRRYPRTPYKN